jgi:rRNA maturation endonuclease Nob1
MLKKKINYRQNGYAMNAEGMRSAFEVYARSGSWKETYNEIVNVDQYEATMPQLKALVMDFAMDPKNKKTVSDAIWRDYTRQGLSYSNLAEKYYTTISNVIKSLEASSIALHKCKYFWNYSTEAQKKQANWAKLGFSQKSCPCGVSPSHSHYIAQTAVMLSVDELEDLAESDSIEDQVSVLKIAVQEPSENVIDLAEDVVEDVKSKPALNKKNLEKFLLQDRMHITDIAQDIYGMSPLALAMVIRNQGLGKYIRFTKGRFGLYLPKEDMEALIYEDDLSLEEIASELNTNVNAVQRFLDKNNIMMKATVDPETENYTEVDIVPLLKLGYSVPAVSQMTNVAKSKIYALITDQFLIGELRPLNESLDEDINLEVARHYEAKQRLKQAKESFKPYKAKIIQLFLDRYTVNEIEEYFRALVTPIEIPRGIVRAYIDDEFKDIVYHSRRIRVPLNQIMADLKEIKNYDLNGEAILYIDDFFLKAQGRKNPSDKNSLVKNGIYTTAGGGFAYGLAYMLDSKYPKMSKGKRTAISTSVPTALSLGVYAYNKDEAALYSAAGSIVGGILSHLILK